MKLLVLIIVVLTLALVILPGCEPKGDHRDFENTATDPDGSTHHSGAQPQSL